MCRRFFQLIVLRGVACSLLARGGDAGPPEPGGNTEAQDALESFLRVYEAAWGSSILDHMHFLHIPKTGSSFVTTLVHYVCGHVLPHRMPIAEPYDFFMSWGHKCPYSAFSSLTSGHHPLPNGTPREKVAMMVRDPVKRILSGYFGDGAGGLHSCRRLRAKYRCGRRGPCAGDLGAPGHYVKNTSAIPVLEYAMCVENCMANMLTGRPCATRGTPDIFKALDVVSNAGFVGLTEHWVLSICLFHAKFGGEVFREELVNVRPGILAKTVPQSAGYHEAEAAARLGFWRPQGDSLVYEAAVVRFFHELNMHGLTLEACAERHPAIRMHAM